ncbi:MAG TPA: tyrosine-type recombinase/integrase, partial [Candidatus Gemmiger stercoripullorum]|nr:tyrosine-type recombinase/integrase [Candidatus Gemmiger stercoripullorum]
GCKSVRFHDLRHTFATMSLENGMDVKTLSTIIGHVSSATTLNTYTHITDEMRRKAAVNIDQGIAGVETVVTEKEEETTCSEPEFTPVQPARRRPGTGYLKQIKENLWEGRYSPIWPDGKKHSRNVYGHTEAECEEKLKELILQMKAEIAALRSGETTEYPDGVSPKKKAITAYLREHPGVTSKGMIARELGMDRSTVQRYYDEIREELLGEDDRAS